MDSLGTTLFSSHQFLVRPYEGLDALKGSLELSQIVIDGSRFPPGPVSLPVERLPFNEGLVEIYLDVESLQGELRAVGLGEADVRIACVAYGSVIAASAVLMDVGVCDVESPLIVRLEDSPLIFRSPNGFDVRVFLYLAEDLPPDVSSPYLSGTWLSYREFRVAPYSTLSRFSPTPLDDDLRRHFGLPIDCMTYIRVGDDLLEAESLDDEVDVFLDVAILRLLQESPSGALAKYIQLDLAISTILTILSKVAGVVYGSRGGAASAIEHGPAWGLCMELANSSGSTLEEFLNKTRHDPGYLRAVIESHVKGLRLASLSLREVV